jgi:hypothetical protein
MRRNTVILGLTLATAAISLPGSVGAAAPQTPVAIVQAQVEAYNSGDAKAFAAFYAEDVEIFDLGPNTAPMVKGRAALIARYEPLLRQYRPKTQIVSQIESGNFVIDKERVTAGGRTNESAAIYQVENGKIRRVWFTP